MRNAPDLTHGVYITGTDTGIGKTYASRALLQAMLRLDINAVGMKPVASGCETSVHGLRNADALDLMAASALDCDYGTVNPYAFADPIAPHLAAADSGVVIDLERIGSAFDRLRQRADFVVVEGVGGWLAPLGDSLMQSGLVVALDLPVILVVGLRLGCLNHALLTARAIESDGCRLLGWIANRVDPAMLRADDNISTLRSRIHAPLLGIIEHGHERLDQDIDILDDAVRTLLADPGT
jgi:dethiobiotin synthetase